MLILRILLFVLFFSFDVKIKARAAEIIALPLTLEITQEPANCLKRESLCALRTGKLEKFHLKIGSSELTMDQQTTLIRIDARTVRIVSGTLWVRPHGDLNIETEYGDLHGAGEYWISRSNDNRLHIIAFKSDVSVSLRGYNQTVTIPRGFECWVGEVNLNGHSPIGIPTAINPERHIETWARLYSGTRNMFLREVKAWYAHWRDSVTQSSQMHRDIVQQRTLALADERRAQEEKKRAVEAENRRLRDLFRHKVLFE